MDNWNKLLLKSIYTFCELINQFKKFDKINNQDNSNTLNILFYQTYNYNQKIDKQTTIDLVSKLSFDEEFLKTWLRIDELNKIVSDYQITLKPY